MNNIASHPRWRVKIAWILVLGLVLRVAVALISDQIHQPDEVFSYLEQAHRLVFGYGVIPWEFRYGIRSWLVPDILAGLLATFRMLHIDDPRVYTVLIKLVFCGLSLSLIYTTYVSVRALASETAATLAAFVVAVWYELLYFASKPTPEVLATYCLVGAFACAVVRPRRSTLFWCGLLAGMAAILRFQYLPAVLVVGGLALFGWRRRTAGQMAQAIAVLAAGFLIPVVGAGLLDVATWGGFLISYYNSFVLQSIYGVSDLFGVVPAGYFPWALLVTSSGVFLAAAIAALAPTRLRRTWMPLVMVAAIVVPHSLVAHKEYRFVVAAIPFLVMLTAIVVADLAERYAGRRPGVQPAVLGGAAALLCVLSVGGIFLRLPYEYLVYGYDGTLQHASLVDREGILSAYLYVHDDPEVAAVAETYAQWYLTGGYYYLHRNVPIYLPGQLSRSIALKDYSHYVSHIICRSDDAPIPGFQTVARFGDVDVRKAVTLHSDYLALHFDNIRPYQPGVDNRFHAPYNTVTKLPQPVSIR